MYDTCTGPTSSSVYNVLESGLLDPIMPIVAIDCNLISPNLHVLHAHVTIEGSIGVVTCTLSILANRPYDIIAMRKWNELFGFLLFIPSIRN